MPEIRLMNPLCTGIQLALQDNARVVRVMKAAPRMKLHQAISLNQCESLQD